MPVLSCATSAYNLIIVVSASLVGTRVCKSDLLLSSIHVGLAWMEAIKERYSLVVTTSTTLALESSL